MTIETYIKQLESKYEYCFTRAEIEAELMKYGATLNSALYRQSRKKNLLSVRRGMYMILPVKYQSQGALPLELFIDQFAAKLNKQYYVGLYSAALRHGASHQAVMEHYVITDQPKLRNLDKKKLKIKFLIAIKWPKQNIQKLKSESGYYNISSPALTIADLIHYQNKVGGYNRVYTTIHELIDSLTTKDIKELCAWYPFKSVLQRMGFILTKLNVGQDFLEPIKQRLAKEHLNATLLVEMNGQRPGKTDTIWKIDENVKLQSDL